VVPPFLLALQQREQLALDVCLVLR